MYKQQIQKEIKNLEKELGLRMADLDSMGKYADLTPSNRDSYNEQYSNIEEIERKLSINNKILERIENSEIDYDDHLDTGMDTSIDINDFGHNQNNE